MAEEQKTNWLLNNAMIRISNFALQLRMLLALTCVPKDDATSSYSILIESNYYTENEEILERFFDYFENTWLGKLDRRKRRK